MTRRAGFPDPDQLLCFAVYSASHAFTRAYRKPLAALGLTYPQYLVMAALWAGSGEATVGGLGAALRLESSTLTPLIKRLEAMGLVARRRDPDDERQVRVGLTARGRALRAKAQAVPACIGAATGLSDDALRRLTADLAALRDRLLVPEE